MCMRRGFRWALVLVLWCVLVTGSAMGQGQGNLNPGIAPPGSKPHGLSYGEWAAEWWNWALSTPAEVNPLLDESGTCGHIGQQGQVWFLAGTFGGSVERHLEIPSGTALFFPILNTVVAATEEDETEEQMRAQAREIFEPNVTLHIEATIDGIPVQTPWGYAAESPAFTLHLPEGALLDQLSGLSGDLEPAVAAGYWLFLNPLPVGTHEIHFRGVQADFETEVMYEVTVVPRGRFTLPQCP
jgi:hypothetical protein